MINLVFTINREVFRISIDDKTIWYSDRKWKKAIRLIPKDNNFILKIKLSRNAIPYSLIDFFDLTSEEQEEYSNCETDKELAEICIRDAKKKGAILLKNKSQDVV